MRQRFKIEGELVEVTLPRGWKRARLLRVGEIRREGDYFVNDDNTSSRAIYIGRPVLVNYRLYIRKVTVLSPPRRR